MCGCWCCRVEGLSSRALATVEVKTAVVGAVFSIHYPRDSGKQYIRPNWNKMEQGSFFSCSAFLRSPLYNSDKYDS